MPAAGSVGRIRPTASLMRILYTASESSSFAKTGGLADVADALPKALARLGHDVRVVIPKYGIIDESRIPLVKSPVSIEARFGPRRHRMQVWSARFPGLDDLNLSAWLIGNEDLFGRRHLYQENGVDYPDNLERFASFCQAVAALPEVFNWIPDVVHANDWQTGLVPIYLRRPSDSRGVPPTPSTVFTIHNAGYQGLFPGSEFSNLGLASGFFAASWMEYFGQINLLKAGCVAADLLTTVSPTYAREIQTAEYGHGLDGLFRHRADDLVGVLNGIDHSTWNPAKDLHIARAYSAQRPAGKKVCKRELQKEVGLSDADCPVFGHVSRLAYQKGVDLILDILPELVRLPIQLIVLGSGDRIYQEAFERAAARNPDRIAVRFGFDEGLAHRIEAGSDIFLMPSRYEPCGLNQLYSMRYGTLPIVRRTGGLADSVVGFVPSTIQEKTATGFVFEHTHSGDLLNAILLALEVYQDRKRWTDMVRAAMTADFSWEESARTYSDVYEGAGRRHRGAGAN